jgi:YVTN family beta-propeller protein
MSVIWGLAPRRFVYRVLFLLIVRRIRYRSFAFYKMNNMKKLLSIGILFLSVGAFAQRSGYKVVNTFHIKSGGGWDYIALNTVNNRLYVSHGTQMNVLDAKNGDSVGVIMNTPGVHGIAFVPALTKGYISNGRGNNVTVIDYTSNQVLTQIQTGEDPDAIMYDAHSDRVYVCNGRSKDITVIDPTTDKVTATIPAGGAPETAVTDNAGKIYVNLEDKNEIIVLDTKTMKVVSHWPLGAEGPAGLAIDTKTKRLFAGCEGKLVVVNATNGKIVSTTQIGDGCDGTAFDPGTQLIFASNGAGTLSVIKEHSADKYEKLEDVPTKRGARTLAIDARTHMVYLPAAEYEPKAPNTPGRPKMIPGTFQVLVIGKQ